MVKNIMSLGIRIRTIRESLDLSIVDFAEKLSVSSRSISYYEKDEKEPTFSFLEQLVSTFNVSSDFLIIGKGEPFISSSLTDKKSKVYDIECTALIGKRILDLRKNNSKILLASVSDTLNINVNDLDSWEKGKASIPADILIKLSEILGVTPCYLLTGQDSYGGKILTKDDIQKILELYYHYIEITKPKDIKEKAMTFYGIYRDVIKNVEGE